MRGIAKTWFGRWLIAGLAAALLLFPHSTTAEDEEDILIIANKSVKVDKITINEIQDFFLKRRSTWPNGNKVIPVNAPASSSLRKDFQRLVLKMTGPEESRYWQDQKIKKGVTKPPEFGNTLKATFKLKNSISYVYRPQYNEGVSKVLLVVEAK